MPWPNFESHWSNTLDTAATNRWLRLHSPSLVICVASLVHFRWDMLKEKRPCFKDREWYTIPLMVTRRGKKGKVLKVTYEAQRRPV
ncbi:hypothetical protein EBR96_10915, partial [bacterium]|nr:hypothetical protein [bacterium]